MTQTTRPKPPVPRDYNHLVKDWARALQNLRDGRTRLAARIKTISDACRTSHGKAHPVECDPCYGAIIEETRRRYLGAGAGAGAGAGEGGDEWFSGREDFLRDLDRVLDDAKRRRVSLSDVEALIAAAKKAWYRGLLRQYPYFVDVALNSLDDVPRFRELVADARQSEGDVADVVRRGIGRPRGGPVDVEAYVSAASREEKARLLFEADGAGSRAPEGTEAYASLCADAASGLSVEQVMGVMDRDRIGAVSGGWEEREGRVRRVAGERARKLEERRARLQELQRARTAHRKIQRARSQKLAGKFYAAQSCPGCAAEVRGKGGDVLACSLCQVLLDMGVGSAQTVYCSMKCCEEVHDSHTKSRHPCSSGESCLQHTPSPPTPATVLCKECTTHLSVATPYCSTACAATTMKAHLQEAHPVVWAKAKDSLTGAGGGDGGGDGGGPAPMADVAGYVVALTEVHSERVGKKLKRSSLVDV
ncbi:uncharacterized protein DNG_06545 [Cephalotrichum gorgonifer]|uniref:Uncharacterized protein n=1 Tax=Cephalotrichum gorgonifer TaxID=2041049 RepID=A0AAE8N0J3_9PEZI|nr:uncharacterized protein DNG_06545 [Cephalotrichum gorgonifer]